MLGSSGQGMELLSPGTGCGASCQPGSRESSLDSVVPYSLSCPLPVFALAPVPAGEEEMFPLRAGSSVGLQPGAPCLPRKWCWTNPSCHTRKATVNHRSLTGCFSLSLSVRFTFFDSWTMKCFPEEYVPFEMHILKALYSINGLVFLSHLSQTP